MFAPIPRDIPLPLPASPVFLEVLLVVSFIAHILFVNLMVGGAILVLAFEVRGLRDPAYDRLARALATTLTVNKSLAVVLGVAPLLVINVLYTIHFYTANALTGLAWILVVPATATAFLLLYLHKYTWDRLRHVKGLHIAIQGLAVALLLVIPLVFLTNANLMMLPDAWTKVRGFGSAVLLPNVFPRYLHFLSASLILTSLFGVGYFGRAGRAADAKMEELAPLTRPRIRRAFYAIALAVSLAQYVIGPLVLFTVPGQGMHASVLTMILAGAMLSVPAVWMMWQELSVAEPTGKLLPRIAAVLGATVLCMATGRQMVRGIALADHRAEVQAATERWAADAAQAAHEAEHGLKAASASGSDGETLFRSNCSGCHGVDRRIVGPPLTEIATIYAANPDGIVAWARAPGKKRADSPQMPAFPALGDAKLRTIAEHMIQAGAR